MFIHVTIYVNSHYSAEVLPFASSLQELKPRFDRNCLASRLRTMLSPESGHEATQYQVRGKRGRRLNEVKIVLQQQRIDERP